MNRKLPILVTVCTACLLMPFAMAGVSVALPGIATSLHAGLASEQWVVNGYDLAFGALMLAFGSLADLLGRRRVFTAGVSLFCLAAVGAAAAPSILVLDLARAAAGAGAAAALTSGSAILGTAFDGRDRMRAFAVFGTVVGLGLAFGATVAGALVSGFGWRSVFVVTAVVAALVVAASRMLPESRNPAARRADWGGTVTFTAGLGLLILGLIEGPQLGWASPVASGSLAGFAVLLGAFFVIERRIAEPMFDLSLMTSRRFTGLCVTVFAMVTVFTPLAMDLPSYLMSTDGDNAATAGRIMLLMGLPTLVFPSVGAALQRRIPVGYLMPAQLLIAAAGAAWLLAIRPHVAVLVMLGPLALIGTAIGLSFGQLDNLAISSVPPERAGMAAGMFNTTRIGGETAAIAVIGSILVSVTAGRLGGASRVANQLNQGSPARGAAEAAAYTGALHTVAAVLVAVCVAAAVSAAVLLRDDRRATAAPSTASAIPAMRHR
ncbi:MAG: MFS transporter [Streptosporangiaceae bacterium]|jgi:MFS family permease